MHWQDLAAAFQRLFLSGGQSGILDLLHLIAQQIDPALLFGFVGDHGIQLPLDAHKLPVQDIIVLKLHAVLRIIIQNARCLAGFRRPTESC